MCAKIFLNHQKESKKKLMEKKDQFLSSLKYGFQFQETYEFELFD